eukprot:COSAG02_NODE_1057_length_14906_cov_79.739853_3_plen_187_part_00
MALACGVATTLTTVVTVCFALLHAFVLNSAAERATTKAGETAELVAAREAADRHHKELCTKLEDAANSLDDMKPLSEQADLWQQIVDQIEPLERSWEAVRDAVRKAEYTASQRRWADIRRLGKRVARKAPHGHLHMRSIVAAVEAHPLVAFGSVQNMALSIRKPEGVMLPLKANMEKLGAGTRNLK